VKDEHCLSETHVHNSETIGQAKDEGKKRSEVLSARDTIKEVEVPKARGKEEDLQSQG
jgi:hypothetical protein